MVKPNSHSDALRPFLAGALSEAQRGDPVLWEPYLPDADAMLKALALAGLTIVPESSSDSMDAAGMRAAGVSPDEARAVYSAMLANGRAEIRLRLAAMGKAVTTGESSRTIVVAE